MKRKIIQIFLSVLCFSAQAQKVSNIKAEQRGQDIIVSYLLETSSPCEVILLVSEDNGGKWDVPLKGVSGDVGKNIRSGENQIIWKVLDERDAFVGDEIMFKIKVRKNEIKVKVKSDWLPYFYIANKSFSSDFTTSKNYGLGYNSPWVRRGAHPKIVTASDLFLGKGANNDSFFYDFFQNNTQGLWQGSPMELTFKQNLNVALIDGNSKLTVGFGRFFSVHTIKSQYTEYLAILVQGWDLSAKFFSSRRFSLGAHYAISNRYQLKNIFPESIFYERSFSLNPSNFSLEIGIGF